MTDTAVADSQALESLMVRVADEFIDRLNRGEQPDIETNVGTRTGVPALACARSSLYLSGTPSPPSDEPRSVA
jgi:hypothetical protein